MGEGEDRAENVRWSVVDDAREAGTGCGVAEKDCSGREANRRKWMGVALGLVACWLGTLDEVV